MDLARVEILFQKYSNDLKHWIPDGIIRVDIELLQKFDILDNDVYTDDQERPSTHAFSVLETEEKITLMNDQYVVWIVPEQAREISSTLVLIAIQQDEELQPEIAFCTSGIYNTSRLVLRILEKILLEIEETKSELNKISL